MDFENRNWSQDGNHGGDKRQAQADDLPDPRPEDVDEHRSRAADAAGRRWAWRKFDAQWVRAGDAQEPLK